jgi:hypothetical protein
VAQVAQEAGCESVVLTHFSQRYPKVPVLGDVCGGRVGVAFDLMTVDLAALDAPAAALPALRALLAAEPGAATDEAAVGGAVAPMEEPHVAGGESRGALAAFG